MFSWSILKSALGVVYFVMGGFPQLIVGGVMIDSPQVMVNSLQDQVVQAAPQPQQAKAAASKRAQSTSRKQSAQTEVEQSQALSPQEADRIANYITSEFGHSITGAGVLSIVGAAASITGEGYGYAAAIALVQAYIHANQALCHYSDMTSQCPLFAPEQNKKEVRKLITITLLGLATAATYAIQDPIPCIAAAAALVVSYPIKKLVNINPAPILNQILGLVQQRGQAPARAE